jgi:hypothetical protein
MKQWAWLLFYGLASSALVSAIFVFDLSTGERVTLIALAMLKGFGGYGMGCAVLTRR